MKKIITLLLVFVLSFSLFASCKKKQDSTPESTGTPPISESISESVPESIPAGSTTGSVLANALTAQIKESKSMRVELSLHNLSDWTEYHYETDETGNPTDSIYIDENYSESVSTADVIFSIGEDGKLDAKMHVTEKYSWDRDIPLETEHDGIIYIIDNNLYEWSESATAWVLQAEDSEEIAQIAQTVKKISDGELLSAEDEAKLFAELGEFINTSFSVKDYKGSITLDGKPHFESLLNYLKNLDLETKTVVELIDDGLKLIDSELTAQKVLAKVKEFANLTAEQALAKIDAWLTQNYQTTVQGVYDKLVANDLIAGFIADTSGVPAEDRENVIASIRDTKIADMIAEFKDVPVYDLIMSALGSGSEYPPIGDLFTQIDSILALTLAEFEQDFLPFPILSSIKENSRYMTVNKMDAKMDIQFSNIFRIDSIQGDAHVEVSSESPSEVDGETDYSLSKFAFEFKISEISASAIQIALPSGDKVLEFFVNGYYENKGEGLADLWVFTDDGEAYFELAGELPSGIYVSYMANIPLADLENPRIEIAPENIDVYVNYELYEITLDKSIIVEVQGDYFVIEQVPDLGIADVSAYMAIKSVQDGENVYYVDPSLGITIDLWNGSSTGRIFYNNPYPLNAIIFEFHNDLTTGNMVCTIVGYGTDGHLKDVETGIGYVGSEPSQIPVLFGGDIEFTFYVTEDGMITCDDMPEVLPQYII